MKFSDYSEYRFNQITHKLKIAEDYLNNGDELPSWNKLPPPTVSELDIEDFSKDHVQFSITLFEDNQDRLEYLYYLRNVFLLSCEAVDKDSDVLSLLQDPQGSTKGEMYYWAAGEWDEIRSVARGIIDNQIEYLRSEGVPQQIVSVLNHTEKSTDERTPEADPIQGDSGEKASAEAGKAEMKVFPVVNTWRHLKIIIRDDETLDISYNGEEINRFSYRDFGFVNEKSKNSEPNYLWEMLLKLSAESYKPARAYDMPTEKNSISQLRKRLKKIFHCDDQPIEYYNERNGYKTNFLIIDNRPK